MSKDEPPGDDPASRASTLLVKAQTAAKAKDALGMVEALHASGFLAGLKRMLQRKWSRMPAADVDDSVADAVESAYTTVSGGRRVGDLGAWLWKAADNVANDRWERDHAVIRELDDAAGATATPETTADERQQLDALAEHRKAEAVRLARQLLAAVGHGQVREVMELVIDAVEAGEPDLPPEVVADTLAISRDAARALMSRGLTRLKAAARAQGFELPDEIPAELPPDEDDETSEKDPTDD